MYGVPLVERPVVREGRHLSAIEFHSGRRAPHSRITQIVQERVQDTMEGKLSFVDYALMDKSHRR